ncbi:MAG: class I tRNA ligase family protein [Kineosporiaceae bacterium]
MLDRYLLAKTHALVATMTEQLDAYDIAGACQSVRDHLDVLTNWYIRRSRERFWATATDEPAVASSRAAFDTLARSLEVLTRLAAPLLPLVTEDIWQQLTGGRSVHLTDWPSPDELPADDALVAAMDAARAVASATLGLRKAANLRVRLPLPRLTVVTAEPAALQAFSSVIADEVNVREVRLVGLDDADGHAVGVDERLTVNARAAGPRLGRAVQQVIQASKAGDWSRGDDGGVVCGGVPLVEGEYTVETVVSVPARTRSRWRCCPAAGSSSWTPPSRPRPPARGWSAI